MSVTLPKSTPTVAPTYNLTDIVRLALYVTAALGKLILVAAGRYYQAVNIPQPIQWQGWSAVWDVYSFAALTVASMNVYKIKAFLSGMTSTALPSTSTMMQLIDNANSPTMKTTA